MKIPGVRWPAAAGVIGLGTALAQGVPGAGYGANAQLGAGYGAVTVARVSVAPISAGGWTGGAGVAGPGGAGAGGGGLFGVTRRTYMAEANAVAAGFFRSAGVPLNTPAATGPLVGTPPAGAYWARQSRPANPGNGTVRPPSAPASPPVPPAPKAEPPEAPAEAPPFAPPVQLANVRAEPARPSPGSSPGR